MHPSRTPIAAAGLLALASLACTVALFESPGGGQTPGAPAAGSAPGLPTPVSQDIIAAADAEELLLINIYQRVAPAVVNVDIGVEASGEVTDVGSGSGFVIDPAGYIVTNNHVIEDADALRVTFSDGSVLIAEVVGGDEYADLAVIKVDPPADRPLVAVELGDSSTVQVGQRVIAIGNPFGLTGSMTVGIVSAVGRTLPSAVVTDTGIFSNPLIIQTDAAINPGNSGGPLLNSRGQVIGVNAALRSQTGLNSGIGFAIPVNTVKRIAPQLIETGRVEYPYLGISAQTEFSLALLAEEFDLPVSRGVLIASVAPGSAADRAGLRGGTRTGTVNGREVQLGGDIITAIDGTPIGNFDELLGYLVSNTSVGQRITVSIVREGRSMEVEVTLGARPTN